MILDLANIRFTAGFFSVSMPDGSLLVLNNVNENFIGDDGNETEVKRINIIVEPVDGSENISCSSVIGMGNDYLMLKSDYAEHLGKVLTEDNMKYCTMELYEDEE